MIKRVIFLLVIILPASAATATVFLTCTDLGDGVVQLSYDWSQESCPVVGFCLDIRLSKGVILLVDNINSIYGVYPGQIIIIDECGHLPINSPVAEGGLGTSGMTIEMGALYIHGVNPPPPTGVLLTFMVSEQCDISVSENEVCGGVVLEDLTRPGIYAPGLSGVGPPGPGGTYGGGTGMIDDPYLISTAEQLNSIGLNPGDWHKHFKLINDIDMSSYGNSSFNIIGQNLSKPFSGTFDGNNCNIHNFSYYCAEANFVGLFGCVNGSNAAVKDLSLIAPRIYVQKGFCIGSLVGSLGEGTISSCCASRGSVSGGSFVGGLVGWNYDGTIINCYSTNDVLGGCGVGGLVGKDYATISNCYSTGKVDGNDCVGGLSGFNSGAPGEAISGCYSTGSVSGNGRVSGLVAYNSAGAIVNSFWDVNTSGQTTSANGVGKTTAEMKTMSTFTEAGWDFVEVWGIGENQTYPYLRFAPAGDFNYDKKVDLFDLAIFADNWLSGI